MNHDWSDKTILVAEDMELNYILISRFLRKTGIKILWAKNGHEAVDIFERNKGIDLILMDIRMPEMDGFEAIKIIRESAPDLPIIAQTANALDGDAEKSIELGCNDYISKPINMPAFFAKLGYFLQPEYS
jgi:two-component system, cell cycle response regulator DivK